MSGIDTSISSIEGDINSLDGRVDDLEESTELNLLNQIFDSINPGVNLSGVHIKRKGSIVNIDMMVSLSDTARSDFNSKNGLILGYIRSANLSLFGNRLRIFDGITFKSDAGIGDSDRYGIVGTYDHGSLIINGLDEIFNENPLNGYNSIPARAMIITNDGDCPNNKNKFFCNVTFVI